MDMLKIYKAVLDADRAAVVLCDLDHRIIYMNPVACERYSKWAEKSFWAVRCSTATTSIPGK